MRSRIQQGCVCVGLIVLSLVFVNLIIREASVGDKITKAKPITSNKDSKKADSVSLKPVDDKSLLTSLEVTALPTSLVSINKTDQEVGNAVCREIVLLMRKMEKPRVTYRASVDVGEGTLLVAEIRPPRQSDLDVLQKALKERSNGLQLKVKNYIQSKLAADFSDFQQQSKYKVLVLAAYSDSTVPSETTEYIVEDPSMININASGKLTGGSLMTYSVRQVKDGQSVTQDRYSHVFQTVID
jgi:hypothetical protein